MPFPDVLRLRHQCLTARGNWDSPRISVRISGTSADHADNAKNGQSSPGGRVPPTHTTRPGSTGWRLTTT